MTRLINDPKLDFKDVLIVPKRSSLVSRSEVILDKTYVFKHSNLSWSGIPIVCSNMDNLGTMLMADTLANERLITALVKHYSLDELVSYFNTTKNLDYVSYSLGISEDDLNKFNEFKKRSVVKLITIDVANFYTETAIDFLKRFRDENPNLIIMAGNIATPEMAEQLLLSGADIIKGGLGSGAVCETRKKTGVGYPQLSLCLEVADAIHGLGGLFMSDGGITCPGDMCKAFGAGSDFVMIGSQFAGTDEGGGKIEIDSNGNSNTIFYGMSSETAQEAHGSSLKEYRASEGRTIKIPYRGSIKPILQDYLGGLRSCLTYTGSKTLKELPKRTTFIRVTEQINTSLSSYSI